jgi:PAS domain S-box-containing protein
MKNRRLGQDDAGIGTSERDVVTGRHTWSETQARESEARLAALFEHSPVAIWEQDFSAVKTRVDRILATGVADLGAFLRAHRDELAACVSAVEVLAVNETSARLFGRPKAELSLELAGYFVDDSLDVFAEELAALAGGQTRWEGEFPVRMPDGGLRLFSVAVSVVPGHEATWGRTLASLIDITDRKVMERLHRVERDLAAALAGTSDLAIGLDACLAAALRVAQLDTGAIYLVNDRTDTLDLRVHRNLSPEFVARASRLTAGSPTVAFVRAMKPTSRLVGDGPPETDELLALEGMRAIALVPMCHEGRAFGCLNVASRTTSTITPLTVEALEMVAVTASHAVTRMKAEAALQETLTFRREAEKIARVGAWMVNPDTDYLFWTEGVYEILGVPLDYKPGLGEGLRFYDAESIGRIQRCLAKTLEDGSPFVVEARFTTAGGESRWAEVRGLRRVEEGGQPYIVGTFQDISARKDAEDQIRFQAGVLEETGRLAQVGGWWFDPVTGKGGWTAEVARIYDLDPGAEVTRDDSLNYYTPASRPVIERAIGECVAHGTSYDLELEMVSAKGVRKTVRTIGHARVESGRVVRVHGSFQNITRFKAMEQERLDAEIQLRQSQKMEALGTLAGGVAHDFNNILAIIQGYAEVARRSLPPGSPTDADLQEVLEASDRAKDLVRQILAFSRKSERERKPTQVRSVVEDAMRLVRASIPSTIQIRTNLSSRAVMMADATDIHQVLMNLCSNAAHAMRQHGGTLSVSLTDVVAGRGSRRADTGGPQPPSVRLEVADTGEGIDSAIRERIFDPFFTTKAKGVGTGLGLAIVHGIVKNHGGSIGVTSEPGRGTTFLVDLPTLESLPAEETAQAPALPRGNERLLVVDDEPALARGLTRLLSTLGYQVESRSSGPDALAAVRSQPPDRPFDLVLSDMTMPAMTGAALAVELLRLERPPAVLLCTGYSDSIDREKAMALGIQGFLMKPFSARTIADTVREVLDARRPSGRAASRILTGE